jgi:acyl transferase domain-containing protein/acyl carrier protein
MPIQAHEDGEAGRSIAIIGMSGRFPRARNVDEFWRNLAAGLDAIRPPTADDSATARIGSDVAGHPDYVGKAYYLDDVKLFDADFFRFTPAEARLTDPQHRIFMECVWEALESAGYVSKTERLRIGIYAGASISHYMQHNLHASLDATAHPTQFLQRLIGNDKDYLPTHIAYKLNLRGPSVGVQTACSSSLVALWLAIQGLADHQCDLALAGGVTVKHAARKFLGYVYEQGNILSPDGQCRPFDASAAGTAFGSGAGVVLLKRLDEAIADRDDILAVVREVAVNNDGAVKIGFTAPSLDGQAEVIALAQATADVHPESIGYIEAHGTGTPLGDPVEIAALTKVFRAKTRKTGYCAIGSVKSNVGHLESAAGVTGLIKTVLALRHRQIPPTLHFRSPNPAIDFPSSPFFVNTELRDWPANGSQPRRAGVSSFGIGGTNAHVILEEAPPPAVRAAGARPGHILTLSAQDGNALRELAGRYVDFLAEERDVLSVCFTSNTGRRHFPHRLAVVGASTGELRGALIAFVEGKESAGLVRGEARDDAAPAVAALPAMNGAADWRSTLLDLGRAYVAGAAVDWERFDAPYQPRRITQPTYPFQRAKHWVDEVETEAPAKAEEDDAHPLLGRRIRLAGSRELRFEWRLGSARPAWLHHHRVFGKVVFPMTGFVEAALAGGNAALGTRRLVLENLAIHHPLVLSGGDTFLQTVLAPDGDGYRFEIFSLAGADSWTLHADGRVLAGSGSTVAVESSNGEAVDVAGYYRELHARGLQYGAEFQTIRGLSRTATGAAADVRVPDASGYFVHPALLDGCLQATAAVIPADGPRTHVPTAIARLELFDDPGSEVRAEVRLAPSIDIDLADPAGNAVCRIEGLTVRPVSAHVFGTRDAADCVHRIVWRPQARRGSATTDRGTWLIVSERGEAGPELAAELRKRGQEALFVETGEAPMAFTSGESAPHPAFGHPLPASPRGERGRGEAPYVRGTIHFGGLRSALAYAQTADRPLWLVTRGAQPAGEAPGSLNADDATVWGLGRTLALERPEVHCTCLDLDPARPAGEIQTLADEILEPDQEDQVAWRGGIRFVPRLEPWRESAPLQIPGGEAFQLVPSDDGVLAGLHLEPLPRRPPAAGEVEIRVTSAALNFRDVLSGLRALPGGAILPIGSECAGTVIAAGEGVTAFRAGDEVVALAGGCLASRVTVAQGLVFRKPAFLTADEAAAVPIVFLTAYYGLHRLARLRRGERVLIHAAAGGVGQAALQLARNAGAEIFATAHPRKWGMLESAGVRHVMSSRTTDFASEVLARTGGEGVDVALNCLNGDFIPKTFEALRRGGRFLEIGKIGVWDAEQVRALRPDAAYFRYDIAEELAREPESIREMMEEILQAFGDRRLHPPPLRVFPVVHAPEAFQRMAAGRHVGKVVLSMEPAPGAPFRRDGSYLITGGLGDLGLLVACWMARNGAGRLVLCGRNEPSSAASRAIEEIVRDGTPVEVVRADVASLDDVRKVVDVANRNDLPLRGIVHAAGVVRDALLGELTWEKTREVLAPKVDGARNLQTASRDCPLDFFVCFSSIASALGSPGQANYAAANAYLDALAHDRDAIGLPALSVNWGPWADTGMAARLGPQAAARRAAHGIEDLDTETALGTLERLLAAPGAVQAIVAPGDWRKRDARPLFEASGASDRVPVQSDALLRIRESSPHRRQGAIAHYVAAQVATALGLGSGEAIEADRRFMDLGIDSLIAIELRNRLQADLGTALTQTVIFDYPTVRLLAGHLAAQLFVEERVVEERESPAADAVAEESETGNGLEEIAMLADSEIRRLLRGRRSSTRP